MFESLNNQNHEPSSSQIWGLIKNIKWMQHLTIKKQ